MLFWEWRKAREAFGTTDDVTIIYYCMFETAKKNVKGKRMTTKEAIQAMLDGKKVRKINWNKECYVLFNGEMFVDEEGEHFSEFTFYETTWEIYEEPKPKQTVTIEKWLCSVVQDSFYVIEGTKEFMSGRLEKVKLLDTYEVEL